jgi:hypothetical protein
VQLPREQFSPIPAERRQWAGVPAAVEPGGAAAAGGGQPPAEQGAPPLEGPLLLRVEPEQGCMSTCEAAARALSQLEPRGGEVLEAIMRPLTKLVQLQVCVWGLTSRKQTFFS